MGTVFLYAGQGSQYVGMGKDFYESCPEYRAFIDSLQTDIDLKTLMHEGPLAQLSQTENTQACMAAFAAGVTKQLAADGITPDAACGLSLGEYGALFCAGVFSAEDYVNIAAFRGRAMADAAKGHSCAMSAVLGTDRTTVEEALCACLGEGYVTIANDNCPGQYVICGDERAVAAVEGKVKAMGARRCMRLNVSGPFHTKYMAPAGERLGRYLEDIPFAPPEIPLLMNVTGDYLRDDEDLKTLLVRQVQSGVRFEDQLRRLLAQGYEQFIEIGPGNVIAGFVKKAAKAMQMKVSVKSISTLEDYKALTGEER